MRILAFSDWRVQDVGDAVLYAKTLREPIDVIVYAGDDLARFEQPDANYFSELAKYCRAGVLLGVAGNDDTSDQKTVLSREKVWDLYERPFVYGDTAFLGVEGSTSGPGILQHTEGDVRKHLATQSREVKGRNVVVVSHPPPYGVLDEGIRFAEPGEAYQHIGSTSLRNYVKADPAVKLVICGHCHSRGRLEMPLKHALVVNVASHDSQGAEGRLAVIDYNPSKGLPTVIWGSTFGLIPPDFVRNLHGVGPGREKWFYVAGIETMADLVKCSDLAGLSSRTGISEGLLIRLKLEAQAHLEDKMIQTAPYDLRLEDPMFFDIETDLGGGRVWLVGTLWRGEFRQFYSDTWAGEKRMLQEFLGYLSRVRPSVLVSYSCTSFDRRVLELAISRCRLDWRLFSDIPHVDLGTELGRRFIFPMKRYTVKEVGRYFGYPFEHGDLDGFLVAFEYIQHLEEKRPLDKRVLEYNRDDVKVIEHIVHRLERAEVASLR